MKLSELKSGEHGVIVKVSGHGGFRKRIIEMGFIKGKSVECLQNAPLLDPVKYRVMGYEVSLRRSEADRIEVVDETSTNGVKGETRYVSGETEAAIISEETLRSTGLQIGRKRSGEATAKMHNGGMRDISIALVGNPNCGKTSFFNFVSGAHERVGNYAGVTVDAKEGVACFEGYRFRIIDLPGAYSLSPYSPEELYVRKELVEHTPDVVINVIDASNLERNLYLTTQLIDMNVRMVCALNMFDETERRGDRIDSRKLSMLLGVPMVPTVFTSGKGVAELFHIIINVFEGADFIEDGKWRGESGEVVKGIRAWHDEWHGDEDGDHLEDYAWSDKPRNNVLRHIHINHGRYIEEGIARLQVELKKIPELRERFSTRFLAIKLLERDKDIESEILAKKKNDDKNAAEVHGGARGENGEILFALRDEAAKRIEEETSEDSETAVMNAKYAFIHGALQEAGFERGNKVDSYAVTHVIDGFLTNRVLAFPLFFLLLFLVFHVTFTIGEYPMEWIDGGVGFLISVLDKHLPVGPLKDMLLDGALTGVGAVIVFLPQILILYAFISFMEDTGYMARAAFIMDKLMHGMGLHGKSFIPLLMGFGCNVPAIMSTRTIESPHSRLVTILILPFMSCSARLPIYLLIVGTCVPKPYQSIALLSLYVIGILVAIVSSRFFSHYLVDGDDTPFVMELPPYRMPTLKAILRHTWQKAQQYLKKMGGIILVASIIVWALGYFPHDASLSDADQLAQSYIGRIGTLIQPLFAIQHFDWQLPVSLIAGVGAKEIVASTLAVLYAPGTPILSMPVAVSYLIFVLLYFPCLATIAAIRVETNSWKWAFFTAVYTTMLAWILSGLAYYLVDFIIGN